MSSPLWSDGARKRRWIALPEGEVIAFDPTEAWTFPVGTALVKHFELETAPGEVRRLETRVLLRHTTGWQGYTYRWNDAQDDADLLTTSETGTFGGQSWYFPSSADCLACHTEQAGRVLGARTLQLNRDHPYPGRTDNQLRAWNHIGLFDRDIGNVAQYGALPDPRDGSRPLAGRARSYLDANCAQCHRPGGPAPVDLDLRSGIPAADMHALGVPPVSGTSMVPGSLRIAPGRKEMSVVWELMGRTGGGRMPLLATSRVDGEALELIGAWIDAGAE